MGLDVLPQARSSLEAGMIALVALDLLAFEAEAAIEVELEAITREVWLVTLYAGHRAAVLL